MGNNNPDAELLKRHLTINKNNTPIQQVNFINFRFLLQQ